MAAIRNAFSVFGFAPEEATIDTLRTDLALALRKFIENSQMGQAKIGEVLGLKQNVVSQIVRGKTDHLSVERLIKAMVRAKIPGYAEWGASAEDAIANVGVRIAPSANSTIALTDPMGTFYGQWWGEDRPIISSKPLMRLGSPVKS